MPYRRLNGLLSDMENRPSENARQRFNLKKLSELEALRQMNESGASPALPLEELQGLYFSDNNTFRVPAYSWKPNYTNDIAQDANVDIGVLRKSIPRTPTRQYSQAEEDAMMSQHHARERMQAQARQDAIDLANFRRNKISPQEKFIDPVKAEQIEADRLQRMKKEQQGRDQQNESWLTRLKRSAREKFTDPTSMALLQGGLTAMNPNSYWRDGFYSVPEGLTRGLNQGVKTFRQLSAPIEPSFQDQQELIHKNKMEQIGLANQGRVPSLINSYNMAKAQGFEGTLLDYQVMLKQAGRNVTNIDLSGATKGSIKTDEAFGKELASWYMKGGEADTMKQISQLEGVYSQLIDIASGVNTQTDLTGSTGILPKGIRAFTNPKSVQAQEAVEEVVQRNLKAILGAQFTAEEGKQLIERAYNPKLDEAENARRIGRLLNQMKVALQQKREAIKYFREHDSLQGYTGREPTMADFTSINFDNPGHNYNYQKKPGGGLDEKSEARRQELLKKYPDMNQGAN